MNNHRESSCALISQIETYINKMARNPKNIDRKIGDVSTEVHVFKKTEEYAQESYDAAIKNGIISGSAAVAGIGMTVISASQWRCISTTFGRENTNRIIKIFSKTASKNSKLNRNFWKFGLGITAGALVLGMTYVSYKNYDISNKLMEGTIQIRAEINHLRKKALEIDDYIEKINLLENSLRNNIYQLKILCEKYGDYIALSKNSKRFLISYINNTYSLSELLNKDIN